MRRLLSVAALLSVVILTAAPAATAQSAAATQPAAAQGSGAWQWLRAYLFGAPTPGETAAAALARLGGSRLLMEADTDALRAEIADDLRDDVRRRLRAAPIAFRDLAAREDHVEVRVRDVADLPRAIAALAATAAELRDMGDGLIRLTPPARTVDRQLDSLFDRTIDIIDRRLAALGYASAGAQRQGLGGIAVLLPGVKDPTRIADLLARRGALAFRLIDVATDPDAAVKAGAPDGFEVLYGKDKRPYVVSKHALLTGADLIEANAAVGPNGDPVIDFRFTEQGKQAFAHITEDNVGKPFAIVLDGGVVSAPLIREPIRGGSGQISGGLTVQEANDLALLLRSGALAFDMTLADARTVAPEKK